MSGNGGYAPVGRGTYQAASPGSADLYENDRPPLAVPYSSIFRNDYNDFSDPFRTPTVTAAVQTENLTSSVSLTGLQGASIPLTERGFAPEDADLKLGPFYLKLDDAYTAWLYTDNANLTQTNRESGVIGIVGLSLTMVAQITESIHFALGGTVFYLPLVNKFGFSASGLPGAFLNGILGPELFRTELRYDTIIGGWPVVFADDFGVQSVNYSTSIRDDSTNFDDESHLVAEDRVGRYAFGGADGGFAAPRVGLNGSLADSDDAIGYANTISASTEHLFPGSIRLRVELSHENLWYNQGNRGLPTERDAATVAIIDERENLRFKPYFVYEGVRSDEAPGITNSVRLGLSGPITDNLSLDTNVGYFENTASDHSGLLGLLSLNHDAGPYTNESLSIGRSLSYFPDEVYDFANYRISQVLGPSIRAAFFVQAVSYSPLIQDGISHHDYRSGLEIGYSISPKTYLSAVSIATYEVAAGQRFEAFTQNIQLRHSFTDTLVATLFYQYQKLDAGPGAERSFYENLVFMTLTKYFR